MHIRCTGSLHEINGFSLYSRYKPSCDMAPNTCALACAMALLKSEEYVYTEEGAKLQ